MRYNFRELVIDSRTGLNPRKNFVLGNGSNYYITIKDIHAGKIVITDKTDRVDDDAIAIIKKRSRIKNGDVLFTSIGRVGETAIVANKDDSWDVNESVFVFTLNDEIIIAEYFCLLFQSQGIKDSLMKNSTGSTFKSIKMSQLERMSFEIPSIEIQKDIVEKAKKTRSIIEGRKHQLSEFEILIKARFVEMFGDPISNSFGLPEATLPELGEFGRGLSKHRPRNDPRLLGGAYPLIQTGDVAASKLYIDSYSSTYSELGLKQSKMWKKGTLCITIAANIAKTAILNFDACFPDSVVGFIANEKTDNIFIHYWFSFFQSILEAQAPESAQKNINLKILSELKVIVPEKKKQGEFAAFVAQTDKSKVAIQKSLDETQVLFDSLMQEYFG